MTHGLGKNLIQWILDTTAIFRLFENWCSSEIDVVLRFDLRRPQNDTLRVYIPSLCQKLLAWIIYMYLIDSFNKGRYNKVHRNLRNKTFIWTNMPFQTVFWSLLQTQSSYIIIYGGTRYGADREFPAITLDLKVMSLESKDAVVHSGPRYM